jgi:hypothetical protein
MPETSSITEEELGQSAGRESDRQAVLLIHGIGEQQPMTTLRDFLKGLFGAATGKEAHVFSKPDRVSNVMEMRRMSADRSVTGVPTDFYELYWAHLMQGTTLGHVQDWIVVMLLRRWKEVPERLRPYWLTAWALLSIALVFTFVQLARDSGTEVVVGAGVLAVVLWVARFVVQRLTLSHVGDAARYLRPAPENIGIRQAIRSAGVDVLKRLHDEPLRRYDRIVIVGHSLGSVIAYDILTHFWQQTHWVHNKPAVRHQPRYDEMSKRLAERHGQAGDLEEFRTLQRELLKEESGLGMPWKVTDFVTLGSPLTYADFLMADAKYPWGDRTRSREMPTCPPQLEDARDIGFLAPQYQLPDGTWTASKSLLHHGALFACTKWTNLYFLADIIGGPLRPLFGDGVKDVPLDGAGRWSKTKVSHIKYWHHAEGAACRALKDAMQLSATAGVVSSGA